MATDKDIETLRMIREALGPINRMVAELSPYVVVDFDTVQTTSIGRAHPTKHLVLKAEERNRL